MDIKGRRRELLLSSIPIARDIESRDDIYICRTTGVASTGPLNDIQYM
jgi:hypothetical protein